MIVRVCESAAVAVGKENVIVATDSSEVSQLVINFGYRAIITSSTCLTGTDRVAEAMRMLGLKKAVNVQGDEPMIEPALISLVLDNLESSKHVLNLATHLDQHENPNNPSTPKLVVSQRGDLIYASRSAIPGSKDKILSKETSYLRQVCVYGFNIDNLMGFGPDSKKTPLEESEDIELLRFVEDGVKVKIQIINASSISVDHPSDISKVEKALVLTENKSRHPEDQLE
jgi:3-deoxy-manno-octulosonate cytidylyltransferase (CMP-KDO synthetase)